MEIVEFEEGRHKRLRRYRLLAVDLRLHEDEPVPELWLGKMGLLKPLRLELFQWFGTP